MKTVPTFLIFGDGTLAQAQTRLAERLAKESAGCAKAAGAAIPQGRKLPENLVTVDVHQFQAQRLASLDCHKTQWTPEVQARLRQSRRDYRFEESVWAGGGQGAFGKWVGP